MTVYSLGKMSSVHCDRCPVYTEVVVDESKDKESVRTYVRRKRKWALVRFYRGDVEWTRDLCHRCATEVALALTWVEDKA